MTRQVHFTVEDELFAGDDLQLRFTVRDAAGVAVDITGWAVEFIVRRVPEETPLVSSSVGSGITLTTPASGVLDISIADEVTDDAAGTYMHTLRRTDAGFEKTLAFGDLVLRPKIGAA